MLPVAGTGVLTLGTSFAQSCLAAGSLLLPSGAAPLDTGGPVSSGKFLPRLTSEHFPFRGGQWESEKGDSPLLRQCGLLPYVRESAGTLPSRGEALHTS